MIFEWQCEQGHIKERFEHHPDDRGCETIICVTCHSTMAPITSFCKGRMLYFEESRSRRIENLATLDEKNNEVPCPALSSWKKYEAQKKKAGVTEAGSRMGEKGVWI